MRNKKKQLLFGCLAALVLSAGAFPAFAQDQDSFSTNMESSSQNSVPVAVDITAVYGRNAKPGQHLRPDGGTVFRHTYCLYFGE